MHYSAECWNWQPGAPFQEGEKGNMITLDSLVYFYKCTRSFLVNRAKLSYIGDFLPVAQIVQIQWICTYFTFIDSLELGE